MPSRFGEGRERAPSRGKGRRQRLSAWIVGLAALGFLPGCAFATHPPAVVHKSAIMLQPGTAVGRPLFPSGDTKHGGQGQHVDGIQADIGATVVYHVHVHLSLFHNGKQIALPAHIGILPVDLRTSGGVELTYAYYWLHTHDESGIIHVESPIPPTRITFTLGDFFDIWGEPLSAGGVAGWHGPVHVFVGRAAYHGDPRKIVLKPHEQITLEVGGPPVSPPFYTFPRGY